jgi:hypothetical protein
VTRASTMYVRQLGQAPWPRYLSDIKKSRECIICHQKSDNGKFMCRKCAEEIKTER